MGFADTNGTDEKKTGGVEGILLGELAGGHAGRSQGAVGAVELKVGEFAVFVAFGDASGGQQRLRAGVEAAVTAGYAAEIALGDGLPSGAIAERTRLWARGVG